MNIVDVYVQIVSMMLNDARLCGSFHIDTQFFQEPFKKLIDMILELTKKFGQVTMFDWEKNGFDKNDYVNYLDAYGTLDRKSFERYQLLVVEDYKNRKALEASTDLKNKLIDFDSFAKEVEKINEIKTTTMQHVTSDDLLKILNNQKYKLKFMHYPKFMAITKMNQNDLVILAAGTGKGKTSLALNLMSDLSINYQCVYLNMEVAKEALMLRILSSNTGVPINALERYPYDKTAVAGDDLRSLERFSQVFEERKVQINHNSLSLNEVRAIISSHDQKEHFIVFIDHIGLIGCKGNAYERMTAIAKELRKMSLDYNCTIIALCQLNRNGQQTNKRPELSDLRDSGEIEQSASIVVLMHELDKNDYEINIAKNRSGQRGRLMMHFRKDIQKFNEIEWSVR